MGLLLGLGLGSFWERKRSSFSTQVKFLQCLLEFCKFGGLQRERAIQSSNSLRWEKRGTLVFHFSRKVRFYFYFFWFSSRIWRLIFPSLSTAAILFVSMMEPPNSNSVCDRFVTGNLDLDNWIWIIEYFAKFKTELWMLNGNWIFNCISFFEISISEILFYYCKMSLNWLLSFQIIWVNIQMRW